MHKRYGIKGLALLVAALGVLAVSAASAQATEADLFLVEGASLGALKAVEGSQTGSGRLLSEIGADIECKKGILNSATSWIGAAGAVLALVLFAECAVLESGVCTIYPSELDDEMGTNAGLIHATGVGTALLDKGVHYLVLEGEQDEAGTFTTIYFGGPECNLPLELQVAGSVAFESSDALTSQETHHLKAVTNALVSGIETLLGTGLFYGGGHADLHGLATGKLTSLENWNVH